MAVNPFNPANAEKALVEIKDIFDGLGLELILIGGTCLGAYRDKSFCAGDKDIDFAVLHECFKEKIYDVVKVLSGRGCISMVYSYPYTYARALHTSLYGVRIDIVDYDLKNGIRFSAHSKKDYCLVYPARLFEDMETIELYGKAFKMPSPVEEYLTTHYTESWRKPDPDDFGGRNKDWGFWNAKDNK